MTLSELVAWVDAAMARLRTSRKARERVRHVRRLYRMLDEQGPDWEFHRDWHALGVKVAELLGEAVPEKPDSPGIAGGRARWRRPGWEARPAAARGDRGSGPRGKERKRRRASKPAREAIEVNPRLQAAFDAVAAGRQIVFVTGGAGTGKSTFIREVRARFPEKQSVVLAPTGVAALNAGGQTIHSFCRLPLRPVLPQDARLDPEHEELIRRLDLVIIDEISMVRADVLDGVDAFLRLNRESDLPFGGVQMVLVGDLFQLPPVVTREDQEAIAARYPSPHFFSARCLGGRTFFPIELEIVYRQRDPAFAELLGRIRDGLGAAEAVRQLNERCVGRELDGQHVILVPTRQAAASENDARLTALPGAERVYDARRQGTFERAAEDRLPAPAKLVLKPKAQVMFVRNDYPEGRWVNGTLGTVTSLEKDRVRVRLADGSSHEVEPIAWEDIRYALDEKSKEIVEEIVGTYTQFPLMHAWAVTIHKAQGLTLARVMVDLARGAFAEGQVYVALSRCQSIEGLSLRRPVRIAEVRVSEAARAFYEKVRRRGRRDSTKQG